MKLDQIFKDLVVLELANVLAGPAVGMFFSELGARVIKVENRKLGGDITRKWKLPEEDHNDQYSAYYHSVNYKKEVHFLDLKASEDYQMIMDLIDRVDIVICNFKPGSDKKLGLDYLTLKKRNAKLIYGAISAYGEDNDAPGFDLVIQAETGWMFMNGEKDGLPLKMPVALMDVLVAHQLKEGILVALIHRMKTGLGAKVHASIYDAGISSLKNQASNWLNAGVIPQRIGSRHPNISPYGDIVTTQDNRSFVLAPGTEKHFQDLCSCISCSELAEDERFKTNQNRLQNRDALFAYLQEAVSKMASAKFVYGCTALNIPIAEIRNMKEVLEDPKSQKLILSEEKEDGQIAYAIREVVFSIEPNKN